MTVEAQSGRSKKQVDLQLNRLPKVIGLYDNSLLANKLVLDFTQAVRDTANTERESYAHLNLAVALMRIHDWARAKLELNKVQFPPSPVDWPSVRDGTKWYLLGECFDALGSTAEADDAFRKASLSRSALVMNGGPFVHDLAALKLNSQLRRRR